MSRVFLVNIGANSAHGSIARSPRFADGSFVFVPFPNAGGAWIRNYPHVCRPFVRATSLDSHDDPDWPNLTYGDDCANGRAGSLQQVTEGDLLLFWGMLWGNRGNSWQHFDGSYGWYLLGAFRIAEIVLGGRGAKDTRPEYVGRALGNVHFSHGQLPLTHRVFIADPRYSTRFQTAIDLEVHRADGLIYRTIRTADGRALALNRTPKWNSSLRSCRPVWDLDIPNDRLLACAVRDEIMAANDYNLFDDMLV
ncbi:MAG TPA: hypothetical protein VJV03_20175 [Pyrinomonadaceae bacterium]|nr:hypothetical protein [Pyrinomonadaceae bacterium]